MLADDLLVPQQRTQRSSSALIRQAPACERLILQQQQQQQQQRKQQHGNDSSFYKNNSQRMAHLSTEAAIFSPSVARLAASTAKDWSYVDAWLASKYKGHPPPPFERNLDTLKALLALASLNETADEDRELVARVNSSALREIHAAAEIEKREDDDDDDNDGLEGISLSSFKDDFLAALQDNLTCDGAASLDAMASAAVQMGIAFPEPAQVSQAMLSLQARKFDLEQAALRIQILQRHIEDGSAKLNVLLQEIRGDEYRPPADLARQNLDMQRKVKAMSKKVPEMKDKVASMARAVGVPNPTIDQVRQEEEKYLRLLDVKRALDQQLVEFEGLPPNIAMARQQLDALRRELRDITDRRNAVFEGLVERETPRKGR